MNILRYIIFVTLTYNIAIAKNSVIELYAPFDGYVKVYSYCIEVEQDAEGCSEMATLELCNNDQCKKYDRMTWIEDDVWEAQARRTIIKKGTYLGKMMK